MSWCLLAMNRAVHPLLFQTNCSKNKLTWFSKSASKQNPRALPRPEPVSSLEILKQKVMPLNNFQREKKKRKKVKGASHTEAFKLNLSLPWIVMINPGKWNNIFHKSGHLLLAERCSCSPPFLKQVQEFVLDPQPLEIPHEAFVEEEERSTWDEFEKWNIQTYLHVAVWWTGEEVPWGKGEVAWWIFNVNIQRYSFLE